MIEGIKFHTQSKDLQKEKNISVKSGFMFDDVRVGRQNFSEFVREWFMTLACNKLKSV